MSYEAGGPMLAASRLPRALAEAKPRSAIEAFAFGNLAFLGVDIGIAHAANEFAHRAEWIPLYFSALAPIVLIASWLLERRPASKRLGVALGLGTGWLAISVGVVGLVLHLQGGFFAETTMRRLVYAAPFVAPLSYAGVGLLLILNRSRVRDEKEWAQWVMVLALAGFLGNFGLSLVDHAQNGFFDQVEWVPVISAAIATGALVPAVAMKVNEASLRMISIVMVAQIVVGLVGFGYHIAANLSRPGASWTANFLYGAPAFAPLLFADLAVLALVGAWALAKSLPRSVPDPTS